MLDKIQIQIFQFVEDSTDHGVLLAFKKAIYKIYSWNRVVVPTYKELYSVIDPEKPASMENLEFFVLEKENMDRMHFMFKVKSRRMKVNYNINSGYILFIVVFNNEIIGDIWCAVPRKHGSLPVHPDLNFLRIQAGEKDVYMFDMYIFPKYRGNAISNYLMKKALFVLKEQGYSRVYGYYESDNLPAMWAHRVCGYKEMDKIIRRRILFYNNAIQLVKK